MATQPTLGKEVDLKAVEGKIAGAAFDLFRYWTKQLDIHQQLVIKTEERLVEDLRETLIDAIISLKEEKEAKGASWDLGFVFGFIMGALGERWYQEYWVKNQDSYRIFVGLRALEHYLDTNHVAGIKIEEIYKDMMVDRSNIQNPRLDIPFPDSEDEEVEKVGEESLFAGNLKFLLTHFIQKQIEVLDEYSNSVNLPVKEVFSRSEIRQLINDNRDL